MSVRDSGLVQPFEWLPIIFNEHEAGHATIEEAQRILGRIMALYNEINAAVLEERVALPGDCRVRARVFIKEHDAELKSKPE